MVEEEEDEDADKEEDENIILVVMQGARGHGRAAPRHLVTLGHLEVRVPGSMWPWGNCWQKSPGTTGACPRNELGWAEVRERRSGTPPSPVLLWVAQGD